MALTQYGAGLISELLRYFTELHHLFGIHLSPSAAFYQQTNGSTEWTTKTVAQVLRAYVNSKQTN